MTFQLKIHKIISAPRSQVFTACVDPSLMEKWFFPGGWSADTTNELRIDTNEAAETLDDESRDPCDGEGKLEPDDAYYHASEFLEVTRPEKIVFLWSSSKVKQSKITIEFRECNAGTEIILTHENLPSEDAVDIHRRAWEQSLEKLSELLVETSLH